MIYRSNICKKGHELKPNNIIWFMGVHGKYLRKCKKCDSHRRKNSIARKQLEHRRYMKRSANKLKHLNVTGIILGTMSLA